ncbi:hypothetical protein ABW20_dc0101214 [Dactylellina cionopaga]|nr:hypothetical protein ABW20_dc0101214 [Dactylellina cionopaga]
MSATNKTLRVTISSVDSDFIAQIKKAFPETSTQFQLIDDSVNDYSSCDVLITDFSKPGPGFLDGTDFLLRLRNEYPALRTIVITARNSGATLQMTDLPQVDGLVHTDDFDELPAAVTEVAKSGIYMSRSIRDFMSDKPSSASLESGIRMLSPRESDVLRCILDGMSITEIADKFRRSQKTIRAQKLSGYKKLGIKDDTELLGLRNQLMGF